MPNFRRILTRRRLLAAIGFLAVAALVFGLLMLHPYPRQSLFGPTFRGKPWCVREDAVANYCQRGLREESLMSRVLQWCGLERKEFEDAELFDDAEMLPIVSKLAEDPDRQIRASMLEVIRRFEKLQDKSILPLLHRRLREDDQENRLSVAWLIWEIDRDKSIIPSFLRDMKNREVYDAGEAVMRLGQMCEHAPELIPRMAEYAADPDFSNSQHALDTARRLGKRGVPILIRCLENKVHYVRCMACECLGSLGVEAEDAVVAINSARLKEPDRTKQWHYDWTLHRIDPKRFAYPRGEKEKSRK